MAYPTTWPQDCPACGGPTWQTDEECEWCGATTVWADRARAEQAARAAARAARPNMPRPD